MRKRLLKAISLLLVFVFALAGFGISNNRDRMDMTTDLESASLPVLSFVRDGEIFDSLFAYTEEMQATAVRNSIVPAVDRSLELRLTGISESPLALDWELRSIDGSRLIGSGRVEDSVDTPLLGEAISIRLPVITETDTEYLFAVTLERKTEDIYYYTRVIREDGLHAFDCMDFALEFHEYTFSDNAADFIPTYMDPVTNNEKTLAYTDLTCGLEQLTWGDFTGSPITEPEVFFQELNSSYDALTMNYVVSDTDDSGQTGLYRVKEYYRLRYTESRMYVLNFERTVEQIFQGESDFLTDDGNLNLGIRDEELSWLADEEGTAVCFVQAGELWSYDYAGGNLYRIFSFRGFEGEDFRENLDEHQIRIIRMDADGNVDFVVFGYMSRGSREGQVGIGIYTFEAETHTVEEKAFIPSTVSYQVLKAQLGELSYESDSRRFYFMMEGSLYRLDLDSLDVTVIASGLAQDSYRISESGRYFAWNEGEDADQTKKILLLDLETEEQYQISGGKKNYIKVLDFMQEDLVYGLAARKEVGPDATGTIQFPMKALKIAEVSGNSLQELKTYKPSSGRIASVEVQEQSIKVNLEEKSGGRYMSSGIDAIMNRETENSSEITVTSLVDPARQEQVVLDLPGHTAAGSIRFMTSEQVRSETSTDVEILARVTDGHRYYVYARGQALLDTDDSGEAIRQANSACGVVLNEDQQYIWMRARQTEKASLTEIDPCDGDSGGGSIARAVSGMLHHEGKKVHVAEQMEAGRTAVEILESSLTDALVLDLSGCATEDILFYVSNGSPVLAMTGSDSAVLLIGYTSSAVTIYQPVTGISQQLSYSKADQLFRQGDYHFITYLK